MKKVIIIGDKKAKETIMRAFGCVDTAVSHAINFRRNTPKDVKMRIAAMNYGAKLMVEKTDWTAEDLKK